MAESIPSAPGFALSGRSLVLRDAVLPLVAFGAAIFLPADWITVLFIVVGQAHFAMTFIYQYRGGRMNRWYLLTAGALLAATYLYVLMLGENVLPIFLVVATLFSIHFALDEVTLHGERLTIRTASTVGAFVLLFVAMMLALAFPVAPFTVLPVIVAVVIACGIVVRMLSRTPLSGSERYLWFVSVILTVIGLGFGLLLQVLATVILLHCINWTVGYGERVKADPRKRTRYWIESALTLVGSIALYAVFVFAQIGILRYFFLLVYYDAWAIGHILLSFRLKR